MHLMDVIIAYLYGSLDSDMYMNMLEGLKTSISSNEHFQGIYSIKLQRSLYGLNQFGWMWYNCLNEYWIEKGFKNDVVYPYVSFT